MVKHYDKDEMIYVMHEGANRPICPDCKDHKQINPEAYGDCKNTFGVYGTKEYGQCCCYAEEHE